MDAEILINAINKAIQAGAVPAPPAPVFGDDENHVRAQTDVGIDPAVLTTYIAQLKSDPDVAAIDGQFIRASFGGGVSVDFSSMARLLLAQAIATNDVVGTVSRFIKGIKANAADVVAVLAVSGILTKQPINVGPDITLIPMTALRPSMQRGIALGKSTWNAFGGPRVPIPCALIMKFKFEPVLYRPKSPQPTEDFAGSAEARRAQNLLEEARNLLSLLSLHPTVRMFWVQPDDWLMASIAPGWQISPLGDQLWVEIDVPAAEAEALGGAYFSIEPKLRSKVLRIPLDRLARSGLENDIADQAIDLGIALEALLLHDRTDHGELTFTLSYRGAWLLGSNNDERLEIQNSLQRIYRLRSRAVHRGEVERTLENVTTLARATEICRALIRRIIDLKCKVNWEKVVLGGEPSERASESA